MGLSFPVCNRGGAAETTLKEFQIQILVYILVCILVLLFRGEVGWYTPLAQIYPPST